MPGSWISERITCWTDTSSAFFVTTECKLIYKMFDIGLLKGFKL